MIDEQQIKRQLIVLRIIWAALLLGQVMFFGVSLFIGKNMPEPAESMAQILWYVTLAAMFLMIPLAYVVRLLVYTKGRQQDGTVSPQAYGSGNILFWAMCEGVAMLAITASLLNRGQGRFIYVAMIAFAIQVVNFPTGKPLRPESDSITTLHKR